MSSAHCDSFSFPTGCSACGHSLSACSLPPNRSLYPLGYHFLSSHRLSDYSILLSSVLPHVSCIAPLLHLILDYEGHSYLIGELIDYQTTPNRWDKASITRVKCESSLFSVFLDDYCFGTKWERVNSDKIARAFSERPNIMNSCLLTPHYTRSQLNALEYNTPIDVFNGITWLSGCQSYHNSGLFDRCFSLSGTFSQVKISCDDAEIVTAPIGTRNKGMSKDLWKQFNQQHERNEREKAEQAITRANEERKEDFQVYEQLISREIAASNIHLQLIWVGIARQPSIIQAFQSCLQATDRLYELNVYSASCIDYRTFYSLNWGVGEINHKFIPINSRIFIYFSNVGAPREGDESDPGGDYIRIDIREQINVLREGKLPEVHIVINSTQQVIAQGIPSPNVQWPLNEEQLQAINSSSSAVPSTSLTFLVQSILRELRSKLSRIPIRSAYQVAFREKVHQSLSITELAGMIRSNDH
jgi:hypothetical protein